MISSEPFWAMIHQLRRDSGTGPCKPLSSCPLCSRAIAAVRAGR